MSKIDWTKPLEVVRTNGTVGEVLGVYDTHYPGVVGKYCVVRDSGSTHLQSVVFNADGSGSSVWTIRNKPQKRVMHGWLNCYPGGYGSVWPTREEADGNRESNCWACVFVTQCVEEGEGLDK